MTIEIPVEGEGLADIELLAVEAGAPISALAIAFATKSGIAVEELLVFEEDGEEPLVLDILVEEGRGEVTHHVHRARKIEVVVFYNGEEARREFPPSTRVQRVLDWAVKVEKFHIDPPIAPEMELALHGTTTELPKRAHIGRYVRHPHHKLELDLIRGVIPNG